VSLIELLKLKWTIYGLDAPIFGWIAAGVLLAGTLIVFGRLLWVVSKESWIHRKAEKRLQALRTEYTAGPRQGLSGPAYDAMVQVFEQIPSLNPAWRNFNSQILARRNKLGEEQFWASESAEAAFSETAVIEPRLNRSFYLAFPGIITGTGLLVTFLALLRHF